MSVAQWKKLSRVVPSETSQVAAAVNPADSRAALAAVNEEAVSYEDRDRGRVELFRWSGDHWERTRVGLFPTTDGAPSGQSLFLWADGARGRLRVALGCDGGVLRVLDPDEAASERRYQHRAIPAYATHRWAFADDARGCVWIVVSDGNKSTVLKLAGDALSAVAEGPYFVSAAFDERSGTIAARTVSGDGHRFDGARWQSAPALRDKLDAMCFDRVRGALVALRVVSDERMDVVEWAESGWRPTTPALWAETYRNQMTLVCDQASGALLAFGGQDFDKGGSLSHETLYGREGAMAETRDPSVPPWGRYDTFFATDEALYALDHSSLRVHRRVGEQWESVGRVGMPGEGFIDDRGINAAFGDGALWILDHEARLLRWTPSDDRTEVACGASEEPGTFYSHRVAMGWDGRAGRLELFKGDRARRAFQFAMGGWEAVDASDPPVAGIATGAGTPEGFYVLTKKALHLLRDGAWVKVAGPMSAESYVLRYESKRRCLLAASHDGVFALADDGWRGIAELPDGCSLRTMGSGSAELGVDPARDELVLCDGSALWSLPLDALALAGCDASAGAGGQAASCKRAER